MELTDSHIPSIPSAPFLSKEDLTSLSDKGVFWQYKNDAKQSIREVNTSLITLGLRPVR